MQNKRTYRQAHSTRALCVGDAAAHAPRTRHACCVCALCLFALRCVTQRVCPTSAPRVCKPHISAGVTPRDACKRRVTASAQHQQTWARIATRRRRGANQQHRGGGISAYCYHQRHDISREGNIVVYCVAKTNDIGREGRRRWREKRNSARYGINEPFSSRQPHYNRSGASGMACLPNYTVANAIYERSD